MGSSWWATSCPGTVMVILCLPDMGDNCFFSTAIDFSFESRNKFGVLSKLNFMKRVPQASGGRGAGLHFLFFVETRMSKHAFWVVYDRNVGSSFEPVNERYMYKRIVCVPTVEWQPAGVARTNRSSRFLLPEDARILQHPPLETLHSKEAFGTVTEARYPTSH